MARLSTKGSQAGQRRGKLAIPLPFEDAIRAVLEVKPPPKKKPQPKGKKAG